MSSHNIIELERMTIFVTINKSKRIFIYFILFVLIFACIGKTGSPVSSQGNMDWHIFRGDAALTGYTTLRLPDKPELLWTYKSGKSAKSSPVIHNGITYWSNDRGCISGVDLNGKLHFEYDLKTAVIATPMISESTLYIGRIDGVMTAISLEKKDTIWNYETMGQISASANIMDFEGRRAIVFGSYDNFLYFVDSKDGALINSFETGYYLNGAVALQDNHVVFGGCDAWLRIIDCQTGASTDSLLLDAYIPASPAFMENNCYIGDYSGNIYELQLDKGKIASHKTIMTPTNDNGSFISVPAVTPTSLYFLSDDRYLFSVDRKTGTANWKYMLKGNTGDSSPVVCRDKIIVCTRTGIVTILDAKNGQPAWEYDTGEQIIASPAVIKDYFMILTAKGTLFCFGKEKEETDLSLTDSIPANVDNDLILSDEEIFNKENEAWINANVTKDFLLGNVTRKDNPLFVRVDAEHTERRIYLIHPVYEAYKKMYEAALDDSIKLIITSGHRTFFEQVYEWELRWKNPRTETEFANDVDKAKFILQYRSLPGTTRHHWGTDIDLNSFELAYWQTKEGQKMYKWLKENAAAYGFFQPYTVFDEKRQKGYQEEKWHWSYKPLSRLMLIKYLELTSMDDIIGFEGDAAAKKLPIRSDWVCGINPQLNETD